MVMNVPPAAWISVAVATFTYQFGFTSLLYLSGAAASFAIGFFGYFITQVNLEDLSYLKRSKCQSSKGIAKITSEINRKSKITVDRLDKRLTGASVIDDVLQEMITYIMRDYVMSWYSTISDEEEFPHETRKCLQKIITNLSNRVKEVDWIPFITEQFTDDFGSHVRLYRRTVLQMKQKKLDESVFDKTFFDLESEMEKGSICREHICLKKDKEKEYLQEICSIILYYLMPPEEFRNRPLRFILREILVNFIFLPTIDLISDPDYINQYIVWMCKDNSYTHEYFLQAIGIADDYTELRAVIDMLDSDISRLRGCDTGGSEDANIKAQLHSLKAVRKKCEDKVRMIRDSRITPLSAETLSLSKMYRHHPNQKLPNLDIDKVLQEPNAGNCFLEFLKTIGMERYLELYFNLDAYRLSAEQQVYFMKEDISLETRGEILERLREQAFTIFQDYIMNDRDRLKLLDDVLLQRTEQRIMREQPSDAFFEEIQEHLWYILHEDRHFGKFKASEYYVKALAELDLLREGSMISEEDYSIEDDDKSLRSGFGTEPIWSEDTCSVLDADNISLTGSDFGGNSGGGTTPELELTARILKSGGVQIQVEEKKVAYFVISVTRRRASNLQQNEEWNVYRRFSDFDDFHQLLLNKIQLPSSLKLPAKTALRSLSEDFLEVRRQELDSYLQVLLSRRILSELSSAGGAMLRELAASFLEPGRWEQRRTQMARSMGTAFQPLKSSVRSVSSAVRNMPDSLVDGVIRMGGGVGRLISREGSADEREGVSASAAGSGRSQRRRQLEAAKVADTLDEDDPENVPLRILSLILLEVFDLSNRNMLFRRQLLLIVRKLVTTFAGSAYNQKIIESTERLMSADSIAEYLKKLRDVLWPGGERASPQPARDKATQLRTRLVCRTKLLGSLPTELGTFLGSETRRRGIQRLFNMFQRRTFNRRLVYVLLEGALCKLFPDTRDNPPRGLSEVIRKLHSLESQGRTSSSGAGKPPSSPSGVSGKSKFFD